MAADAGFQRIDAVDQLRQGIFVAFGEFADAAAQGLADAVDFAVDRGVEGGEPFVVDDE